LARPGCIRKAYRGSDSPRLCRFIADRWGILSAFYFLAGTLFVANLIVMAIREEGKESPALVQEKA
jgi:hypothetical protein